MWRRRRLRSACEMVTLRVYCYREMMILWCLRVVLRGGSECGKRVDTIAK